MPSRRDFLKQLGLAVAGAGSDPKAIIETLAQGAGASASYSPVHWCYMLMRSYLFDDPGEIRFRIGEITELAIDSMGDIADATPEDWEMARRDMNDLRHEITQTLSRMDKDMEEARIVAQSISESEFEAHLRRADIQKEIREFIAHDQDMGIHLSKEVHIDQLDFWKEKFRILQGITPEQQKEAHDKADQQAKQALQEAEQSIDAEIGISGKELRHMVHKKGDGRYILTLERLQSALAIESRQEWHMRTADIANRLTGRFGSELTLENTTFKEGIK